VPREARSRDRGEYEPRSALGSGADGGEVPPSLYMLQAGDSFRAYVDATNLAVGSDFAEIFGYDADAPERGPLFRVPVTALRSAETSADATVNKRIDMSPGAIKRHFITVPDGANWADVRIKRLDTDSSRLIVLHTTQLRDRMSFSAMNDEFLFRFDDGDEVVHSVPVVAGGNLELTLAQYWNSLGDGTYDVEVTFEGIHASPSAVVMHSADMYAQVEVIGALRDDSVAPRARFNRHHRYITPTAYEINAHTTCLLYTSPSPRDRTRSRMPSSA